jgi:WD40 repeat protein
MRIIHFLGILSLLLIFQSVSSAQSQGLQVVSSKAFKAHDGLIFRVKYSNDGKYIVTGSYDKKIKLWNAETFQLIHEFNHDDIGLYAMDISPDGKVIAGGGDNGIVRLWSSETGKLIKEFSTYRKYHINDLEFSPDGKILAVADLIYLEFWSYSVANKIGSELMSAGYPVNFSPDRKYVTFGSGLAGGINLLGFYGNDSHSFLHRSEELKRQDSNDKSYSGAFCPDSLIYAAGNRDSTVDIWSVETGNLLRVIDTDSPTVESVDFNFDGKLLASAGMDTQVWSPATGELLYSRKSHFESYTECIDFHPLKNTLIEGKSDGTVGVLEFDTSNLSLRTADPLAPSINILDEKNSNYSFFNEGIKEWENETKYSMNFEDSIDCKIGAVWSVVCAKDNSIAYGGEDRNIYLISKETKELKRTIDTGEAWVRSLALTPDNKYLISTHDSHDVNIWSFESGKLEWNINDSDYTIRFAKLSDDGSKLFTVNNNEVISQYDFHSRQLERQFKSDFRIKAFSVSPDLRYLVFGGSVGRYGQIEILSLDSGKIVREIREYSGQVTTIDITPDSRYMLTTGNRRISGMWSIDSGELISEFPNFQNIRNGIISEQVIFDDLLFRDLTEYGSVGSDIEIFSHLTGKYYGKLTGHYWFVTSIALSDDKNTLVTSSVDGTIKFWDIRRYKQDKRPLYDFNDVVESFFWSPYNTRPSDQAQVLFKTYNHLTTVDISPDSKLVVTGNDSGSVDIISRENSKIVLSYAAHNGQVTSARINPEGTEIVTCGSDGYICYWNADTKAIGKRIKAYSKPVSSMDISDDGTLIATGSIDGLVKLWNYGSDEGTELCKCESIIKSLDISPNGKLLLVNEKVQLAIWSIETGNLIRTFKQDDVEYYSAVFNRDSTEIATAIYAENMSYDYSYFEGQLEIYSLDSGETEGAFYDHDITGSPIISICYSYDNSMIALGHIDGEVQILAPLKRDVQGAYLHPNVNFLYRHDSAVSGLALSPDGEHLVSSGWDGQVIYIPLSKVELEETEKSADQAVSGINIDDSQVDNADTKISADKKLLINKRDDDLIRVFKIEGSKSLFEIDTPDKPVWNFALSEDSRYLAVSYGTSKKVIAIYELNSFRIVKTLENIGSNPAVVTFSPDSKMLACAGMSDKVDIYDIESGTLIYSIPNQALFASGCCFSPDGSMIAVACSDNKIRVFKVETQEFVISLDGKSFAAFSPDNKLFALSNKGRLETWSVKNWELVKSVRIDPLKITDLKFSLDGKYIVLNTSDGITQVWTSSDLKPYITGYYVSFLNDGNQLYTLEAEGEYNVVVKTHDLADLHKRSAGDEESTDDVINEIYQKAWDYIYAEKYSDVLEIAAIYIGFSSESVDALVLRAASNVHLGNYESANHDVERLMQIDPELGHDTKGYVYFYQDKFDSSLSEYDYMIANYPENLNGYLGKADVLREQKNFQEALKILEQVPESLQKEGGFFYFRGLIYLDMKDYPKAIDDLSKKSHAQYESLALKALAQAYIESGDFEKAFFTLQQMVQINPQMQDIADQMLEKYSEEFRNVGLIETAGE